MKEAVHAAEEQRQPAMLAPQRPVSQPSQSRLVVDGWDFIERKVQRSADHIREVGCPDRADGESDGEDHRQIEGVHQVARVGMVDGVLAGEEEDKNPGAGEKDAQEGEHDYFIGGDRVGGSRLW